MFPFGDGTAQLIVTLLNVYRDTKRRAKPYTVADILPGYGQAAEDQDTGAELFANLKKLTDFDG